MCITDLELDEAYSSMSPTSISIARMCLEELKECMRLESDCQMLATAPCAKEILRTFVNDAIGHNRMNIFFPAYSKELFDFINQSSAVVSFLDLNAKVAFDWISNLQKEPYPPLNTIINPHIGLTSEGYFPRLSAYTSLITIYDKWIGLIEKFVSFYN